MIDILKNWSVKLLLVLLALLVPLQLNGCKSHEIELAFETIEQREWGGTGQAYENHNPGLIVITQQQEIASLDEWITNDARNQLQTLDYDTYFALAAFQGWKPSTGYSVQINRITRQDDTINIYALFREPTPEEEKADEVTSPYHLVQVQKDAGWNKELVLNLIVDETIVASYVPGTELPTPFVSPYPLPVTPGTASPYP